MTFFSFLRNLYFYLDALCQKDWETSKKFHGFLVGLYADYAPEKLLRFLKNSDNYPIQVRCFNDTLCLKITQKSLSNFPFFFNFFRFCLFFSFVHFFNFVHFSIFLIFRLFDLFNFVHFCAFILSFFRFFNFIQFFHFCFLNETLLKDFQTLWNISSRKLPFSEFDHYSHIFSFSFFDRRP